jgi:predicted AAA+ superfamily ATPase
VQRAPDLLLAIKQSVDEDRRPGRFLLTCAARELRFLGTTQAVGMGGRAGHVVSLPRSRQLEVDFVLENSAGEIVGIEVKSAASVTRRDFLGLERVASAAGSAFRQGIVLDDGVQTLSFADILRAIPLSALWA